MGKIGNFISLTRDKCEAKKEKKIKHLLTEGGTKKKHCHRNREKYHKKHQHLINREQDHNTVVNISNVPLSSDEKDLLPRGLSFFPNHQKLTVFN